MHSSGVAKSSTSFDWGNGGNATSVGWRVTLCDPMWHVSYRTGVAGLHCELLHPYTLLFTLSYSKFSNPLFLSFPISTLVCLSLYTTVVGIHK